MNQKASLPVLRPSAENDVRRHIVEFSDWLYGLPVEFHIYAIPANRRRFRRWIRLSYPQRSDWRFLRRSRRPCRRKQENSRPLQDRHRRLRSSDGIIRHRNRRNIECNGMARGSFFVNPHAKKVFLSPLQSIMINVCLPLV